MPNDDPVPQASGRSVNPAVIGAGVLVVLLVVFVFQNTQRVRVSFLFFDAKPPLWVALLVTVAVALAAGELIAAVIRRNRKKS